MRTVFKSKQDRANAIREMREGVKAGLKQREIAQILGVSQKVVSYHLTSRPKRMRARRKLTGRERVIERTGGKISKYFSTLDERAHGYSRLLGMEEAGWTQAQMGKVLGIPKQSIGYYIVQSRKSGLKATPVDPSDTTAITSNPRQHSSRFGNAEGIRTARERMWKGIVDEGKTYRQVAEEMGVPVGTVGSNMTAFRREKLAEAGKPESNGHAPVSRGRTTPRATPRITRQAAQAAAQERQQHVVRLHGARRLKEGASYDILMETAVPSKEFPTLLRVELLLSRR